ncbi:MAG: hypothetical protein CMM50_10205 [Rhodospirillaceae bacterium]|nr:hypothetical protein [Rhodospirillaceae bacterium]
MTVSITFRNDTGGNPGKGSNLTPAEVDTNFLNLMEAVEALQAVAFTGESIGSITVTAGQMTVTGDQGSDFGSHTMPVATFNLRGEWATATAYALNDIVTYFGAGYVCQAAHTSAASFEADAGLATPRWKPITGSPRARSRTSVTAETGSKTFAVPPSQMFATGDRVVTVDSGGTRRMVGTITGYALDALFDDVFWKLSVDVVSATGSGSADDWTIIADAVPGLAVVTKTATSATLAASEQGMVVLDPSAPQIVALPAVTPGLWFAVRNASSSDDATFDSDGSEEIDGAASYVLKPGFGAVLIGDGAGWRVVATVAPAVDNALAVGRSGGSAEMLSVPASRIVGRKATGNVAALTAAEVLSLINGATLAGNLFTGVQKLPAGSAAAPALTASSDTDTGLYFPAADILGFAAGGVLQFQVSAVAGAANRIVARGSTSGNEVSLAAEGSDTDIGIDLTPKGTGLVHVDGGLGETFRIRSNGFWGIEPNEVRRGASGAAHHSFYTNGFSGSEQFRVEHAWSAVNYAMAKGGATGSGTSFCAAGVDTNIDLLLTPKGSGLVRFGGHTAIGGESVTGYVTIRDAGGTTRKLAVVS